MNERGQTLLIAAIILTAVLALTVVLLSQIIFGRNTVTQQVEETEAREIAEAGIEYAIDQLNVNPAYAGATDIAFGDGVFDINVSTLPNEDTAVMSTAYYPDKVNTKATKQIEVIISTTSDVVSFNYGVQVGQGGLVMQENSTVLGNVYSNGNIDGANNARITGDAIVAGGTSLAADQSQTVQTTTLTFGTPAISDIAQSFEPGITDIVTRVQLYIQRNNNPSDATVRVVTDNGNSPTGTELTTGTLLASATGTALSWVEISLTGTPLLNAGEKYWIIVDAGSHASKNWTIGSHDNSGYGNGIGMHYNGSSWLDSNRDYNFKTFMGGATTHLDYVVVGDKTHTCDNAHYEGPPGHHGDAYANTITNSWVECDVHYQTISGTTVGRNSVVETEDLPQGQLPISEGLVNDWKAAAQAGGTTAGDMTISTSGSLGPREITGNLTIDGGVELEITGTVYVHGNITFEENAEVYLTAGYSGKSGIIVADGRVTVQNNVILCGAYYTPATNTCLLEDPNPANAGNYSYFLLITTDPSQDILNPSILLRNDSSTVIVYALNGTIHVENNAEVNEAIGYKLSLAQNAEIEYHNGLANANFVSGPGASFTIKPGSWRILQ